METVSPEKNSRYYVPAPSAWPFILTAGLFFMIFAFGHWLEGASPIPIIYPAVLGAVLALYVVVRWNLRVAGMRISFSALLTP